MKHQGWIRLTGVVWFLMGAWLLIKGLHLAVVGAFDSNSLFSFAGNPGKRGALTIVLGLVGGHLKGKLVLCKTARRLIQRIGALPLPISCFSVYPPYYWIVIGSMMSLGIFLNRLPVSAEMRGLVDLAIGAALISGSLFYFKGKSRE